MSIDSRKNQYGTVFTHWQIEKLIGTGSNGKTAVYKLRRTGSTWGECSAMKVIPLIEQRGDKEELPAFIANEYEAVASERTAAAEEEVRIMDSVKGNTNIVDYADHDIVDWVDENSFGRDMLIRMELLQDLREQMHQGRQFTETEIIKIGRDICTALVLCHRKDILHRDIKPENIFYNEDGNYKLGDFGIAKILSACSGKTTNTGVGTPAYAAPEQGTSGYSTQVDIYSLGLVLYELANNNRLPFITSRYISDDQMRNAIRRRLEEELPLPSNASEGLCSVIMKACSRDPKNRYSSAKDFLFDLCKLTLVDDLLFVPSSPDVLSWVTKSHFFSTELAHAEKHSSIVYLPEERSKIHERAMAYSPVFGNWNVNLLLGCGSGGSSAVFKLQRNETHAETSCLRIINIIQRQGNYNSLSQDAKDAYCSDLAATKHQLGQELLLISKKLEGKHIAKYLDQQYIEWCDNSHFGCDLLLREDLMVDLRTSIYEGKSFSEEEILKIGKDICQSLISCHSKMVIHRDVKPENIFLLGEKDYILGDFAVATIERKPESTDIICTPFYAAPELYNGSCYDHRVDIYALGMVLYELGNGNKLPFCESSYPDIRSLESRYTGKDLPAPAGVSRKLGKIILKACSFKPQNRYQSAEEFYDALCSVGNSFWKVWLT